MGRAIDMEKQIDQLNLTVKRLETTIVGITKTLDDVVDDIKSLKSPAKKTKKSTPKHQRVGDEAI